MKNCILTLLFVKCILSCHLSMAYERNSPKGMFEKDSLKIGEAVKFSLSYRHAKNEEIYFPDKKYNYHPFELIAKEYYPTKTSGKVSLDSAVFILRTFDIGKSIHYAIPVYLINNQGDTVAIHSTRDSVALVHLITDISNKKLIESTKLHSLHAEVNYPYYLLSGGVLAVCMVILFFLFRKPILRRIRLYYIRQGHQNFIALFEKLERDFATRHQVSIMEKALSLWKDYLSRLEGSPINTYTTTEIITLFKNKELIEGLKIIDRTIYRGLIGEDSEKALLILRRFSNFRYQQIKKKIIND